MDNTTNTAGAVETVKRAAKPRYSVGRFPTRSTFVVDRHEGPRRIAVRGTDGEIREWETREEAQAAATAIAVAS